MKTLKIGAAVVAAFTVLVAYSPASAQATAPMAAHGHYEWRTAPQFGPRAPLRGPVRTWVSDQPGIDEQAIGGPYCDMANMGKPGHYEWRSQPQFGPRAPLRSAERVWVEC